MRPAFVEAHSSPAGTQLAFVEEVGRLGSPQRYRVEAFVARYARGRFKKFHRSARVFAATREKARSIARAAVGQR